jgi:hypothetical protein
MRNACILVGKPEGNRQLRRCKRKMEDNIKIGCETVDWIQQPQYMVL